MSISTTATQQLGIQHPILLAGMGQTSGAELAAAVSNAGGLGVIGGVGYTPEMLKDMIKELKAALKDPSLPFGVDLLIPKVGGNARKTNTDYTKGTLDVLVDIIIEGGAKLFVSAVGVPPKHVIDKLHKNGVLYANIVGHPKHALKSCQIGADMIIAQGGEAGGHTGDLATSVLVPAVADVCKKFTSPLTRKPVMVIAAGGIYDGRGLAASLMMGASGVWIGTRFVTAKESGASEVSKKHIIDANYDSTRRAIVWTGRPLRALSTPYLRKWEEERADELKALLSEGVLPYYHELDRLEKENALTEEIEDQMSPRPMGQVSGSVNTPGQTAAEIVDEIMAGAVEVLGSAGGMLKPQAKL